MNALQTITPPALRPRPARGVTLIELLVGLVVGLLATLVIAQTLSFTESQKRTTISGSDAQVDGALALHAVSRDVQMAGFGLTNTQGALGCQIKAQLSSGGGSIPPTSTTLSLAPVVITNGVNGKPDSIQLVGSSKAYALPYLITKDHPNTAANIFLSSSLGISQGDLMIAVPPTIDAQNWCSVFNVTDVNGSSGGGNNGNGNGNGNGQNQINHNSGSGGPWNQPGGQTIFPANGYPAGSYLLDLGQFVQRVYRISPTNALTLDTTLWSTQAATSDELFPNIVQLQAMYGKDTNGDGAVDLWDNTTPPNSSDPAAGATANAAWAQVIAVRIALVARSETFEKAIVTQANPQWDVGASVPVNDNTLVACNNGSKCINLDVGAGTANADAQHYRYKVFDIVIPLRNMIWKS